MDFAQLPPASRPNGPIHSLTVSDRVYLWIKNAIMNGEYKPGERIIQEALTQQLNVSRTPIRDAFQRLSSEGLIVIKPFYGAVVFELNKEDIFQLYELRILLEGFAAKKACQVITEDQIDELEEFNGFMIEHKDDVSKCMFYDQAFHYHMCCAADSEYLLDLLKGVWDKSNPYKSIYYTIDGNLEHTIRDHKEIIQCFRDGDEQRLELAIATHLKDVAEKNVGQIEEIANKRKKGLK